MNATSPTEPPPRVYAHPLVKAYAMRDDAYISELAEDIRANGQREPALMFESMLLDGRARYRACRRIGVEPARVDFGGTAEEAKELLRQLNAGREIVAEVSPPPPDPKQVRRSRNAKRKSSPQDPVRHALQAVADIPFHRFAEFVGYLDSRTVRVFLMCIRDQVGGR